MVKKISKYIGAQLDTQVIHAPLWSYVCTLVEYSQADRLHALASRLPGADAENDRC